MTWQQINLTKGQKPDIAFDLEQKFDIPVDPFHLTKGQKHD